MQTEASLRIDAGWIVPVEPAGIVLVEHSLIVDGELIVDLLPTTEADDPLPGPEAHLPPRPCPDPRPWSICTPTPP
jgi:hypothetical protein